MQGCWKSIPNGLKFAALAILSVLVIFWLVVSFGIEPEWARQVGRCKEAGGEAVVRFPHGGHLCVAKDGRIVFPAGE